MQTIEISGMKIEMTSEKLRRTVESLGETLARLEKVTARKTFDKYQEAEKNKEIEFLTAHAVKLQGWLA
jgi:hypothetical protein